MVKFFEVIEVIHTVNKNYSVLVMSLTKHVQNFRNRREKEKEREKLNQFLTNTPFTSSFNRK